MLNAHHNQVIAAFIDGRLYTCFQPCFPMKSFIGFLYGYFEPDPGSEIIIRHECKQIDPETAVFELSDGDIYAFDIYFRNPETQRNIIAETITLTAVQVLKP